MPPRFLPRLACTTLALTGLLSAGAVTTATADPISGLQSGGGSYAIYLVKDLGGGAYYNVTTGSVYAVSVAGDTAVSLATTTADLLASTGNGGRTLLLLINGAVLVPIQNKL